MRWKSTAGGTNTDSLTGCGMENDFIAVLRTISDIISEVNSDKFITQEKLIELQIELGANLHYLTEFQNQFHDQWLDAYAECNESSNASRERYADQKVRELYYCRKIIESGNRMSISISQKLRLDK